MQRRPVLLLPLLAALMACGGDDSGSDGPAGGSGGVSGTSGQGGIPAAGGSPGASGVGGAGHPGAAGGPGGAAGTAGASGATPGGTAGAAGSTAGAGGAGAGGASGQAGTGAGSGGAAGASAGAGGASAGAGGASAGAAGASAGAAGAGGQTLTCSPDGGAVVDGLGKVVQVCSDGEECAAGACVTLCKLAEASGSNIGCEFWASTPRTLGTVYSTPSTQPCFAVLLANTSKVPAPVLVSLGQTSFDATTFGRLPVAGKLPDAWTPLPATGIPPGEVAVLFLSHDPKSVFQENGQPLSCPVPAATGPSGVEGTGLGEGFHITTGAPVSAYDIFPFGGARSHFPGAQLLFPRAAAGTNYVLLGPPPGTASTPGPMFVQVLALEDQTEVTVAPTADLPATGMFSSVNAGEKGTFPLKAGQYVQWELPVGASDLAGTILESSRRVSVSVGNRFLRLQTQEGPGGETTHNNQQPVSAQGFDYAVAPYETRRADLAPEQIRYRIVGAVDGTTLTYDPPVAGAPTTVSRGQVRDFSTALSFRVSSQGAGQPFGLAQMMTSANVPGGSRPGALVAYGSPPYPLGDEEFVPLLPPAQFRSSYVFLTDPTYATTNLTVIRTKGPAGFAAVSVECLGALSGWKPIGSDGQNQYTTVDLVRAGQPSSGCSNGRQAASSDAPFGLIVWGLDTYSSYGYPAGGNSLKTNDVVVKP